MKYDTAKTWIKIAIPIFILLVGFGLGYLVFNSKIDVDPQIEYLQEDFDRIQKRHDSILNHYTEIDSSAASRVEKDETTRDKINQDVQKAINAPADNSLYNERINSNWARGRKRHPDKKGI